MTGDDLLRRIRAEARFDALPVIIQSAYLGTRGIHDMLELGAAAVLPKPIDLAELKLHITHLTTTPAGEVVAAPRPRTQRPLG